MRTLAPVSLPVLALAGWPAGAEDGPPKEDRAFRAPDLEMTERS